MASENAGHGVGIRLKQAREATAMSTRRVVDLLPERLAVSHVTLCKYEAGKTQPSLPLVSVLAEIYGRPLNWFLETGPTLTAVRYRNRKSQVGVRQLSQFEALAQKWLEAYRSIEAWTGTGPVRKRLPDVEGCTGEAAAERVRGALGLADDQPVSSVMEVLESYGIRVIELPTSLAIDALAAQLGDENVVVVNADVPSDRARMNAAHELGHVLLHGHSPARGAPISDEECAYEFASHVLLTRHALRHAFKGRSMVRLVQFKERYGISLAAMVYRGESEGLLSNSEAKRLWIEFSRRGWRRKEPGHVREERATRFEQIVDSNISTGRLTWQLAAKLAGVREDELKNRIDVALGVGNPKANAQKGGEAGAAFFKIVE